MFLNSRKTYAPPRPFLLHSTQWWTFQGTDSCDQKCYRMEAYRGAQLIQGLVQMGASQGAAPKASDIVATGIAVFI